MNRFASMFGTNISSPDQQYSKFPVILVHLLCWAAFIFFPLIFFDSPEDRHRFLRYWGYQIILTAIYFYINYSILIPAILFRKKVFLYVISLLIGIFLMMGVTYLYFLIMSHFGFKKYTVSGFEWKIFYFTIFPCVLAFGTSIFIRMTGQWINTERKKQILENEKLVSELGFLKSQIHPHFLFNTLNNICSLARKKSDETEPSLIKLSEIMRYMLDDTGQDKVPLSKEIEYLNNYIDLQRLRFSGKVKIEFVIQGDPQSISIEPLLFIPFVENAFKHGVSYQELPTIYILLNVGKKDIHFRVENQIYQAEPDDLPPISGTGLKNVIRRLDLLYPDRYVLNISTQDRKYLVDLKIHFP